LLVEDLALLSRIAHAEHLGLPLFLMGHSIGSFAAQQFVLDHSGEIDGLILSGTGALDGLARLASSASPRSNLLNAAFEPSRTSADWLSRDTVTVDAFITDPLCFAELQPASMESFLSAAPLLNDPIRLRAIRGDLPVYLFSGSADPVGQQLRGVRALIERYRRAGIYDITYDFYAGGRHEMLNEINRADVLDNLLIWISGQLGGCASIDWMLLAHDQPSRAR
jgi:alpha-beta hydrolase superfamily lysophospholipase